LCTQGTPLVVDAGAHEDRAAMLASIRSQIRQHCIESRFAALRAQSRRAPIAPAGTYPCLRPIEQPLPIAGQPSAITAIQ